MTIEEALKQFITAGLGTDRVYFSRAPQNPGDGDYIVFYRVAVEPSHTHSGASPVISRLYQFSAFGVSQSSAAALGDRVRRLLDGYRGLMGTVETLGSYWVGETYIFTPDTTPPTHQFAEDIRVFYREV